jgi:20S proteasome alpha/beta subunit
LTILVGVRCTDGVVIGADSMVTSSAGASPLVQEPIAEKLQLVGSKAILACTGSVGLAQRVKIIADEMWKKKQFSGAGMKVATTLAGLALQDFGSSHVQKHPQAGINFGALMAMVVENEPYLVEFGSTDFQPEMKQDTLFCVSMGSGQLLADPFLAFVKRVLWKDKMPDVERAKIGVYWALSYTCGLAAGGVGGTLKLGVLKRQGIDWSASVLADTQEQAQYIASLESLISLEKLFEEASASAPPAMKK